MFLPKKDQVKMLRIEGSFSSPDRYYNPKNVCIENKKIIDT
jgi:hypothetical protein